MASIPSTSSGRARRRILVASLLTAGAIVSGLTASPATPAQQIGEGSISGVAVAVSPAAIEPLGAESPAESPSSDVAIATDAQRPNLVVEKALAGNATSPRDIAGRVTFDEEQVTPVFPPYAGRMAEIFAKKGDRVTRGQALFRMDCPDLINAQNDLITARADVEKGRLGVDLARAGHRRNLVLKENGSVALKEVEQSAAELARSEGELRRALAAQSAVEQRLALFERTVAAAGSNGKVERTITVAAPIDGTVVDRKIGPGQYVRADAADPALLIANLSRLWVVADVFETDLAAIHAGLAATISVTAYPDRTFSAEVSAISPTVDAATRTVKVRCQVDNTSGLLKPDMFATVHLDLTTRRGVVIVPASAVVMAGDDRVVFIEQSPGHYQRRRVHVEPCGPDRCAVIDGLESAARVVTRGAILLEESLKSGN